MRPSAIYTCDGLYRKRSLTLKCTLIELQTEILFSLHTEHQTALPQAMEADTGTYVLHQHSWKVVWTQRAVMVWFRATHKCKRDLKNCISASEIWKIQMKTGIWISGNHRLTTHWNGFTNWIILLNFEHSILKLTRKSTECSFRLSGECQEGKTVSLRNCWTLKYKRKLVDDFS